mmetsp:Transcript_17405/g.61872  ORF Transcript_17405/g.61872 Transcript_17405/m.61872 type:complete len:85 (-) Transcript_17405:1013-1267(-)
MAMRSILGARAMAMLRPAGARAFAQGPASGGAVSDEMLAKLGKLSTQAIVDGLWVMVRKAGARRRGGRGTDTAFLARGPHLNAL